MSHRKDEGWEGVVGCGCFVLLFLLLAVLFGVGFAIGSGLVA